MLFCNEIETFFICLKPKKKIRNSENEKEDPCIYYGKGYFVPQVLLGSETHEKSPTLLFVSTTHIQSSVSVCLWTCACKAGGEMSSLGNHESAKLHTILWLRLPDHEGHNSLVLPYHFLPLTFHVAWSRYTPISMDFRHIPTLSWLLAEGVRANVRRDMHAVNLRVSMWSLQCKFSLHVHH